MTRIAIVDPQPAVRAGLAVLLRSEPGLVPVGSAGTAEEALELVARTAPDVVLLEPYLGVGDGLQLCRRMHRRRRPARRRLHRGRATRPSRSRCASPCADGIVDKQAAPEELFEALRVVARGGTALPPLTPGQLDAAAARVESDDLALLAMLVDRTPAADVRRHAAARPPPLRAPHRAPARPPARRAAARPTPA